MSRIGHEQNTQTDATPPKHDSYHSTKATDIKIFESLNHNVSATCAKGDDSNQPVVSYGNTETAWKYLDNRIWHDMR